MHYSRSKVSLYLENDVKMINCVVVMCFDAVITYEGMQFNVMPRT